MGRQFWTLSLFILSLLWVSGAQAQRLFLERAILMESDKTCALFHDGERHALASGYWQVRGALLRGGLDTLDLAVLQDEAVALAAQYRCQHPAVLEAAARLRDAFSAFVRTPVMAYPSGRAHWTASRVEQDRWKIVQSRDRLRFGLFLQRDAEPGTKPELAVETAIPERDYANVRLSVRDQARLDQPWLGDILGRNQALRVPPRSILQTFWAHSRLNAPKGRMVWLFPEAAAQALARLDPREAVLLEFQAANPDMPPRQALFEIGDYRAAQAFSLVRAPAPVQESESGESDESGEFAKSDSKL